MSIFSDTFESDLDIAVWVEQELEPIYEFHEHAATFWDAEQQLTEIMSEQIALEMNAKILSQLLDNFTDISNILVKQNYTLHEQGIFCRADGQCSYRNLRYPRAGPIC